MTAGALPKMLTESNHVVASLFGSADHPAFEQVFNFVVFSGIILMHVNSCHSSRPLVPKDIA